MGERTYRGWRGEGGGWIGRVRVCGWRRGRKVARGIKGWESFWRGCGWREVDASMERRCRGEC